MGTIQAGSGMKTIQEWSGMEWRQYMCEGMEWNGDNSGVGNGMGTIQV